MTADLDRIERDVLDLRAEFQAFRTTASASLQRMDAWLIRQDARAEAREDEDTEIRRLPTRVKALEATDGARHWTVRLAESDRGYALVRLGLGAMVACCMALGGGLAWSDLPSVLGFSGGQTVIQSAPAPLP